MNESFPITIYHNPACSTSRKTIALARAAGYEPLIIEYLKVGWTRETLAMLLAAMGARPRDILRETGTPAKELGLLGPDIADEAIIDAMLSHPILVNRPIAVTSKGAALCRPPEVVLDLLGRTPQP